MTGFQIKNEKTVDFWKQNQGELGYEEGRYKAAVEVEEEEKAAWKRQPTTQVQKSTGTPTNNN